MEIVKEITVFLENQPGTLSRIAGALADRNINILGFSLTNSLDHGSLRLVVSDPAAAMFMFGEHNMLALENDVVAVRLANQAGILHGLTTQLTDRGVNVEYAYGSVGADDKGPSTFYVRVSDVAKTLEVLKSFEG
ncbi:MAG: ACT domain-containing protein [Planctomycetes bacterium]|nr:ACT domain-containing protein [Planctomycetota bacterium]